MGLAEPPPEEGDRPAPTRDGLLDAIRSGRHLEAIEMGRELLAGAPEGPDGRGWVLYNLGCALALDGQPDEAVKTLEDAVAAGYSNWVAYATDPDFASLRGHAGFRKIIDELGTSEVVDVVSPGAQDSRTLLVVLHATGADEQADRDAWTGLAKATGSTLVAPRAPVSVWSGRRDWIVDPTDFGPAIKRVGRAIGAAGSEVGSRRVTLVGVGWRAGDLAWRYALARPERIDRVVLIDGRFDRFASRARARGRFPGGVWFVQGVVHERDPRVASAAGAEGFRLLGAEGFTVQRWSVGSVSNRLQTAIEQIAERMTSKPSAD